MGIEIENFPEYSNELEFVQDLVEEQSVFCLPGRCFNIENYMRIVLTVPKEMMIEACGRIKEFCEKHYQTEEDKISSGFQNIVEII